MAASAIDDSVASLNVENNNLSASRSNAKVLETDFQPTRKSTIESLLAMETQAADFTITPTAALGSVLYSTPVVPIGLTSNVTTRMEWISRLFRFWSGDITVKVVFTKTILQQTKLIGVFVPGATSADAPPTLSQAYYYSHKFIMNPTNETKIKLTIPFVSDRPILTTTTSTGMFYIMVYQPLVNTFDSTAPVNIYGKIFISANFDLHETVPLPNLGGSELIILPTSLLWVTSGVTTTSTTIASSSSGSNTFITDSGLTINVGSYVINAFTHIAYNKFKPILASPNTYDTRIYDSSKCRTLFGVPNSPGTARQCMIAADTSLANAATSGYYFLVVANTTAVWLQPVSGSFERTGTYNPFLDGVYNLAGTYTALFTTAFTFPENFNYEAFTDAFTTRM